MANNEVVKYHNDMNKVSFSGFKEKELDLFFSICQKMKDKGTNEVIFSFSDIKKLSNYSSRSTSRFYNDLDVLYKKMLELNLKYEDEKEIKRFVLFSKYSIKKDEKEIIIKASEDFEYILNNLIITFTKFDLMEFIKLKSVYSKNTFKLLKQWESKKKIKYEITIFRELLGVPKGYTSTNFNERVLKPILEELPQFFNKLKIEKIKTGRKVTHLVFSWNDRKELITESKKEEIEISEKLNKVIQKSKKNRFIENLLSNENIEKLINSFNEEELIKGLNWAYKEINREVSSFNYLIKTIKTGAEKSEKKLVIKENIEKTQELNTEKEPQNILENTKIKITEKIIVTQEEYEQIYKNHLKENNIIHNKVTRLAFEKSMENKYKIEIKAKIKEEVFKNKEIELIHSSLNNSELIKEIETRQNFSNFFKSKLDYKLEWMENEIILEELKGTMKIKEESIINLENIPEEKLLSKSGKTLKGGALIARLEKIAREEKKKIRYKDRIIS